MKHRSLPIILAHVIIGGRTLGVPWLGDLVAFSDDVTLAWRLSGFRAYPRVIRAGL